MVRDFTKEKQQKLEKQIDRINEQELSPITDALGDVYIGLKKGLGILELEDDLSNVSEYQKAVMDMNNTTKQDLRLIFGQVDYMDEKHSGYVDKVVERQSSYNRKLAKLLEMIQPNFSIVSAKEIKKGVADINKELKSLDKEINIDFEAVLDKEQDRLVEEGVLNSAKYIGKLAGDILGAPIKMMKSLYKGGPAGLFVEGLSVGWDIVNDTYATASNLVPLVVVVPVGCILGGSILKSSRAKNEAFEFADAYLGSKGLADAMEAVEETEGEDSVTSTIKKIAKGADHINNLYGLGKSAIELKRDPVKYLSPQMTAEYSDLMDKKDVAKKYQDDYKEIKSAWDYFEKQKYAWDTVDKIKNYLELGIDVNEDKDPSGLKNFWKPIKTIDKMWSEADAIEEDILDYLNIDVKPA